MEHHIKRAQLLIVVSIVLSLSVFLIVYLMLSSQIAGLNDRIISVGSKLTGLEEQTARSFRDVSENLSSLGGGVRDNMESINRTNQLLRALGEEITRIGLESQTGIASIRSELNYTGVINKALESVVLIIWTDKESVIGSGFIVSQDGYILTADHVVENFDGKTVRVKMRGGDILVASVKKRDSGRDIALLKVGMNGSSYLEFADSNLVSPGSRVFALGAPEGFSFSATEGIVSAVRTVRAIKKEVGLELDLAADVEVVQTDAAITHGNSGGPLIDTTGRVVGLNAFGIIRSSAGGYQDVEGLNFAIASNDVKRILA